jgi:uncharacterized protein (DUF4415 family)
MASKGKLGPPPADYDPAAPLTDEEIKTLRPARELFEELGTPMPIPRGRPKAEQPKQSVTIRLDPEVVAYYKATGPGWQTRMRDVITKGAPKAKSA